MKVNNIQSNSFKGIYKNILMYYDYPNNQYGKMLMEQEHAMSEIERTVQGSKVIGSECLIADLHDKGWNLLASPSQNAYGIDLALIKGDKFYKEKTKNIFGTPGSVNKLDFDLAVLLGCFYAKNYLTDFDLKQISKLENMHTVNSLKGRILSALKNYDAGKYTQKINKLV